MTEVTLRNLTRSFNGHVTAVDNISLTMPCGRITALLGPSGCGKTTLLKLIAGLLAPDQGEIAFNGHSVNQIPAERRGAVMVFQNHLLFPTMTVGENIAFGLKMRGVDKATVRDKVSAMLALVRLEGTAQRRPKELSGGQQQRVALARALIVEPAVLLLDEPLSNLDAHLRDEMRALIRDIQRQLDITTVVVTHDQEEAVILADQIALIFAGRLQQVGAPRDFYERPSSPHVARFFGGVNFITGHKLGSTLVTGSGNLHIQCNGRGDGPVTATIRPENVRLHCEPGQNCLPAVVQDSLYIGTHARFRLAVEGVHTPFEATVAAAQLDQFRPGQPVFLHLPQEHLWVMDGNGEGREVAA